MRGSIFARGGSSHAELPKNGGSCSKLFTDSQLRGAANADPPGRLGGAGDAAVDDGFWAMIEGTPGILIFSRGGGTTRSTPTHLAGSSNQPQIFTQTNMNPLHRRRRRLDPLAGAQRFRGGGRAYFREHGTTLRWIDLNGEPNIIGRLLAPCTGNPGPTSPAFTSRSGSGRRRWRLPGTRKLVHNPRLSVLHAERPCFSAHLGHRRVVLGIRSTLPRGLRSERPAPRRLYQRAA